MQRLASLETRGRWAWGVAASVALAGCGLVLDAGPRVDAGSPHDAASMDAPGLDAPPAPDGGQDANENVMTFDAIVMPEDASRELDAIEPHDGSLVSSDAIIDPTPDAPALPMDAPVSRDATPETGFGARDAGTDARFAECTGTGDCAVATITLAPGLVACQDTACISASCSPVGPAMDCPPAGACARACQRDGDTGMPLCAREGMRCAAIGDACDNDGQCTTGNACEVLASCSLGVCVPACTSAMEGRTMTFTLPPIGPVTATCNGHGYAPLGVTLPWCAIGVP